MKIDNTYLLKYNSIAEILDAYTTDKNGVKRTFSDIGSSDGEYSNFKSRYEYFKEFIERELPEFTPQEIIKFNKYYHKFKETVYSFNGYDMMLNILEWEQLKNK